MKILVMSDSHGRRDLVKKCIRQHPDTEAVLFLGDVLIDIKGMEAVFTEKQFYCVSGNCDYGSDVPKERLITLQGTQILLTHGHAHGVNYGINMYHDGIYVLNPGSLAYPRDFSKPSYGLIEITPKGILTNTPDFVQFR